jgi:hypothetical protein
LEEVLVEVLIISKTIWSMPVAERCSLQGKVPG